MKSEVQETVIENQAEVPRATTPATPRAWILGLLLIPLVVFAVEYTEIVTEGPDLAAMSLPIVSLFALLIVIPVNLIIKRGRPDAALTQAELLMIYSMTTLAAYLGGIGMMQFLAPPLVGWKHFATPENRWDRWFHFIRPRGRSAKRLRGAETDLPSPLHSHGGGLEKSHVWKTSKA